MDNLMIAQLEFRAEEDAEVAAHTFKKHVTAQAREVALARVQRRIVAGKTSVAHMV